MVTGQLTNKIFVVTFYICVTAVDSVDESVQLPMVIKCSPEKPNPNTAQQASDVCRNMGGSLLSITDKTKNDMFRIFPDIEEYKDETIIPMWTNQCVMKDSLYVRDQYYDYLPFATQVTCNFKESPEMLCILIEFNQALQSLQWSPTHCAENTPSAAVCCLVSQTHTTGNVHWSAKLFTDKVTWYEARETCSQSNGELLLIPNVPTMVSLGIISATRDFFEHMGDIWINYKTNDEGKTLRPMAFLYTLPDRTMEENVSCAYVNANQKAHPMPLLQWGITDCLSPHQFICKIWTTTDQEFFSEIPNATSTNGIIKTIDDNTQTPEMCLDHCRQLIMDGFACRGINFHTVDYSCEFFSATLIPSSDYLPTGLAKNPSWKTFRLEIFKVDLYIPDVIDSAVVVIVSSSFTMAGKIYAIIAAIVDALVASVIILTIVGEIKREYIEKAPPTNNEGESDLEFLVLECDDEECGACSNNEFKNIPPTSVTMPSI